MAIPLSNACIGFRTWHMLTALAVGLYCKEWQQWLVFSLVSQLKIS